MTVLMSFSQLIIKYALSLLFQESNHIGNVREEIAETRKKMSQISMMDEFAKHARLQRKLIKLQDELKAEKMTVSSSRLKYKLIVGSGASLIMGLIMVFLIYMYRSEPVLVLPEKWLSPLSFIISWPSQHEGAVSGLFWISVCGSTSRLIAAKFS